MTRPRPTPWEKIEGTRLGLVRAHEVVAADVARRQLRLIATLDALGPAGAAACDPRAARITLRRRTFRAQCLGSFDGKSWLWSWANTDAAIPPQHTSLASGARDAAAPARVPAFAVPSIEDDAVTLPAMLGGLCCAHGFGEAYVVAGNQVYALLPGQLDDRAWRPGGSPFDRAGLCFSRKPRDLEEVVDHLRGDPALRDVDFAQFGHDRAAAEGDGYAITLRRIADAATVAHEVRALHEDGNPARRAVTLFVVESILGSNYAGTTYPFARPSIWPAGATALSTEAVRICQRLNLLRDVAVYDLAHRSWFPLH